LEAVIASGLGELYTLTETNGEEISQLSSLVLTCKKVGILILVMHHIHTNVNIVSLFLEIFGDIMRILVPTFTYELCQFKT